MYAFFVCLFVLSFFKFEGKLVIAMDALFGLPRKKSAGTSYRDPLFEHSMTNS